MDQKQESKYFTEVVKKRYDKNNEVIGEIIDRYYVVGSKDYIDYVGDILKPKNITFNS
ncbi:MAG: hypothetical protein KatS3mg101_0863 [Patescibacteria group bacterium]|nr:MAG: hypothetical protein KatS3mg101_0863 [Patescibacteria group bacterium]